MPSKLTFHGEPPSILELKKLLSKVSLVRLNSPSTSNSLANSEVDEPLRQKKQKREQSKIPSSCL